MHSGLPTQEHARCVRGIVYFNKQNTRVKRAKHRHLGVCVVGTEKLRTSRPQFMGAFLKSRPQTPEKLLSPPSAVFSHFPTTMAQKVVTQPRLEWQRSSFAVLLDLLQLTARMSC